MAKSKGAPKMPKTRVSVGAGKASIPAKHVSKGTFTHGAKSGTSSGNHTSKFVGGNKPRGGGGGGGKQGRDGKGRFK